MSVGIYCDPFLRFPCKWMHGAIARKYSSFFPLSFSLDVITMIDLEHYCPQTPSFRSLSFLRPVRFEYRSLPLALTSLVGLST